MYVFLRSLQAHCRLNIVINIYHKGCGTMGVPVFASENIELHFLPPLRHDFKN